LISDITGAGVTVGSSDPGTALRDTVKQHPRGTVTVAVDVTFPYCSTAAGVKIARLVGRVSPCTASATAIGVTVPPSGRLILPLNVTSYLAKHADGFLTMPRRVKIPDSFS